MAKVACKWVGLYFIYHIFWGRAVKETRPDTRQDSRGQLGRSSKAKNYLEFKHVTDGPTDLPTDRHGMV